MKGGGPLFKRGNPGGPGRPRIPIDEKLAWKNVRNLQAGCATDWQDFFDELKGWPAQKLQQLCGYRDKDGITRPSNDPAAPVLKLIVARGLLHATSGKAFDLNLLKDMMCGQQPKQIELTGKDGEPLNPLANVPPDQLLKTFHAVQALIEEKKKCKSTQPPPPQSESSARSLPQEQPTASCKRK